MSHKDSGEGPNLATVPRPARRTPSTGSRCSERPAGLWPGPQKGQGARQGQVPGGEYSRSVCWEAHAQEGVQEGGSAAGLEFAVDLGVDLGLPSCHLFLPPTEMSR